MGIVCGSVSGAGVFETMAAKPYKKCKQLCLCEVVLLRLSLRLQRRTKFKDCGQRRQQEKFIP